MKLKETSRDYRRPHRPRAVRALNFVLRGAGQVGLSRPLDASRLLEAAQKRAGLADFGAPDVHEPLGQLIEAIESEAALHPFGRFVTRERLLGVLQTRLRVQAELERAPLEAPPAPPLVITGLERTGTTLLQRLLAADPETRALASWEALNPAALPKDPNDERRKAHARRAEKALAYLAPDFFAIHPVEAEGTEEDAILLDFSMLSPVADATMRVPSYARWLAEQSMRPAYETLATLLALLERQRSAKRWVLKSPAHLPYLATLLEVFPDARVIHTHRHPQKTLPSYCSMIAHGRGIFSDVVDPIELGREILEHQSAMVLSAMEARKLEPVASRVADVYYDGLISDPLAEVARLYEQLGLELSPAAKAAMQATLDAHGQHRFGRHRYDIADFGITPAEIDEAFAQYITAHGLAGASR